MSIAFCTAEEADPDDECRPFAGYIPNAGIEWIWRGLVDLENVILDLEQEANS